MSVLQPTVISKIGKTEITPEIANDFSKQIKQMNDIVNGPEGGITPP